MAIHPAIHRKLLIVPQEGGKHVQFSDLNPIKTFHYTRPPIEVSDKPDLKKVLEYVMKLERKLDLLESSQKENSKMIIQSPESSLSRGTSYFPKSEVSVDSPPPRPLAPRNDILPMLPRNVAQLARPLAPQPSLSSIPIVQSPQVQRVARPMQAANSVPVHRPALPAIPKTPAPQKPSVLKQCLIGAALLCSAGIITGLLSITFLGPIGLGIAGACAAGAVFFTVVASKVQ